MGLDMRLEKRNYVKNWSHQKDEEKHTITVKKGGKIVKGIKAERISYIIEEVQYWRKANHIHDWFINNCATDGIDNCTAMYVTHDQLIELRDLCGRIVREAPLTKGQVKNGYKVEQDKDGKMVEIPQMEDGEVIVNVALCEELLPTTSGFFFGSTDYDQWYYGDCKETHDVLDALLKEEGADRADYYYEASW